MRGGGATVHAQPSVCRLFHKRPQGQAGAAFEGGKWGDRPWPRASGL